MCCRWVPFSALLLVRRCSSRPLYEDSRLRVPKHPLPTSMGLSGVYLRMITWTCLKHANMTTEEHYTSYQMGALKSVLYQIGNDRFVRVCCGRVCQLECALHDVKTFKTCHHVATLGGGMCSRCPRFALCEAILPPELELIHLKS